MPLENILDFKLLQLLLVICCDSGNQQISNVFINNNLSTIAFGVLILFNYSTDTHQEKTLA